MDTDLVLLTELVQNYLRDAAMAFVLLVSGSSQSVIAAMVVAVDKVGAATEIFAKMRSLRPWPGSWALQAVKVESPLVRA